MVHTCTVLVLVAYQYLRIFLVAEGDNYFDANVFFLITTAPLKSSQQQEYQYKLNCVPFIYHFFTRGLPFTKKEQVRMKKSKPNRTYEKVENQEVKHESLVATAEIVGSTSKEGDEVLGEGETWTRGEVQPLAYR